MNQKEKGGKGSVSGEFPMRRLEEMKIAGISEEELTSVLEEWLENPYWAEYYHGAPSERCRRFIALEFRYSDDEDDACARAMDEIEEQMEIPELRYLMKYCGHNPRKKQLHDRIAALGGD